MVKIADITLKKRLEEFKATLSVALTVADIRHVWLEDEMDPFPPAFTKGKEKKGSRQDACRQDNGDEKLAKMKRRTNRKAEKRKGRWKRVKDADEETMHPSILSNSILTSVLKHLTKTLTLSLL